MFTLLSALLGFAILDSLDVLLISITAAVAYDARLRRSSPWTSGLAFLGGVFTATTAFGILAVLGIDFLGGFFDFELTPSIRYWGELILGSVLLALALLPRTDKPPPEWTARFRSRPSLLAFVGFAIGVVQAPTAVPYLAGIAMLSARTPIPSFWPVVIVGYCLIALLPPFVVLAMSTGRTAAARKRYRRVVRLFTRFGPNAVRGVFAVGGTALVFDVLVHHGHLW